MFVELNDTSKLIKKDSVEWSEKPCMVKSDFDDDFVPLIAEEDADEFSETGSQADIDALINSTSSSSKGDDIVKGKTEDEKNEAEKKLREEEFINNLRSEEYKRGFDNGKKAALNQLEEEFIKKTEETFKNFSVILVDLKSEFENYKNIIDQEVIRLSIAIAQKLVKKEVKLDEKIVINQVTESIKKIIGVDSIIIHINPNDEEILKKYKPDLRNIFENLKEISIQCNERIEPGSCKIESNIGNVDGRFSTQMEIIENALMEDLANIMKNKDADQ